MIVELPIFVAVATKPLTVVVTPLVYEAHRNTALAIDPDFLDQPVFEFSPPLLGED